MELPLKSKLYGLEAYKQDLKCTFHNDFIFNLIVLPAADTQ